MDIQQTTAEDKYPTPIFKKTYDIKSGFYTGYQMKAEGMDGAKVIFQVMNKATFLESFLNQKAEKIATLKLTVEEFHKMVGD